MTDRNQDKDNECKKTGADESISKDAGSSPSAGVDSSKISSRDASSSPRNSAPSPQQQADSNPGVLGSGAGPGPGPGLPKSVNVNRPPSTTSVHSNASNGAPRTTTTSRRGGRTRSRSPPVMGRGGSPSPTHDRPGSGGPGGSGSTKRDDRSNGGSSSFPSNPHAPEHGPGMPGDRGNNDTPASPSNPSSAAAAAAAAAKALSSNASQPHWYEKSQSTSYRSRGEEPKYHGGGYDRHYANPHSSWPPEEESMHGRSNSYGHSQSIHRLPPGGGGSRDRERERDHRDREGERERDRDHRERDPYHHGYPEDIYSARGRSSMYRYDDVDDRRYESTRHSPLPPSDHDHRHSLADRDRRHDPRHEHERRRRAPPDDHARDHHRRRTPSERSRDRSRRHDPHDRRHGPSDHDRRHGGPLEHDRRHGRHEHDRRSRHEDPRSHYYKGGMAVLPPDDSHIDRERDRDVDRDRDRERDRERERERERDRDRASPKSRGGMSRVIGTPTPIHVPRASDPPSSSRHARMGTPASVFRGRPESSAPPPRRNEDPQKGSPHNTLLSLRTPTTSFEDKQPETSKRKKNHDFPPSPEEPPQIQNTHNQGSGDQNLFFEPHRSPKNQGSIEMAHSFQLFNQSFDSFGDTFMGPLDSNLAQSASFGAGPTTSGDNYSRGEGSGGARDIQRNHSGGNYSQQLLGSGSGGALTFGMSPVNSFGNGSAMVSSRGRNNSSMMVLGGHDARSTSPTQVLTMYNSYSGGGSHGMRGSRSDIGGPLDDTGSMHLGAGSFGGSSLQHNYTRSFGAETSPMISYHGRVGSHSQEASEGGPVFYVFLRKYRAAFKECTFLLPGIKAALLETPLSDSPKSNDVGENISDPMSKPVPEHLGSISHGNMYPDPSPQDIAVARRRVSCAVCAFGGSLSGDRSAQSQQTSNESSIFREKDDVNGSTATVTPSSSTATPPGSRFQTQAKMKYEEMLPSRYYENENRLSWEFEESPPVETPNIEDEPIIKRENTGSNRNINSSSNNDSTGDLSDKEDMSKGNIHGGKNKRPKIEGSDSNKINTQEVGGKRSAAGAMSPTGEQPKMRYRCKLCGQPKQNHTCPYMQSLARSIGVMVYPAVNAFTANEPGALAPPLSEMNNFITADDDRSVASSTKPSSTHPTPDRMRGHMTQNGKSNSTQVTPESRRSKSRQMNSPSSTLSTGSGTPQRPRTPASSSRGGSGLNPRTPGSARSSRKRSHPLMNGTASDDQGDLLFVEASELKQEQFRLVTPSKVTSAPDAYTYPALPLPYAQRKRLSDNLFSLSKKVPQLTDECAAVLREAREKDLWDLAVAELMTQVVVVIHCPDGDARFEGLRQYLLTLGIAC